MSNLPPGSLGPASMKALDLKIDSYLRSDLTAEGHSLAKFASQFSIGAFQQGGGTYPLTGHALQFVIHQGVLKVLLQGGNGFRSAFTPLLTPQMQSVFGLDRALGLIDRFGLLDELFSLFPFLLPFEFRARFVRHVLELMKNTALIQHPAAVDESHGLS